MRHSRFSETLLVVIYLFNLLILGQRLEAECSSESYTPLHPTPEGPSFSLEEVGFETLSLKAVPPPPLTYIGVNKLNIKCQKTTCDLAGGMNEQKWQPQKNLTLW